MRDEQLSFLIKAHAASGAILQGKRPPDEDLAALGQLLDRLEPVVKKLQTPVTGRSGRFFRFDRDPC